jgi:hypothetical protein
VLGQTRGARIPFDRKRLGHDFETVTVVGKLLRPAIEQPHPIRLEFDPNTARQSRDLGYVLGSVTDLRTAHRDVSLCANSNGVPSLRLMYRIWLVAILCDDFISRRTDRHSASMATRKYSHMSSPQDPRHRSTNISSRLWPGVRPPPPWEFALWARLRYPS